MTIAAVTDPVAEDGILKMTLPEAVLLAVRDNLGLRNAYLGRVKDKYALWVSEGKFVPKGALSAGLHRSQSRSVGADDSRTDSATFNPTLTWKAPTGADFTFTWNSSGQLSNLASSLDRERSSNSLGVSVTQPLLRGGGLAINRISVELARNADASALQSLRSTLMSTISQVIRAYRDLMLARGRLTIEQQAVERARSLIQTNQELIAAGRMPRQSLVQAEADLAQREVSLASSENNLDQARLNLIGLLNLDTAAQIDPIEPIEIPDVTLDAQQLFEFALAMRPDYQQSRLMLENRRMDQSLADNDSEWTLNLRADQGLTSNHNRWIDPLPDHPYSQDWTVGVDLVIPLFDRDRRRRRADAEINLRQGENDQEALRQRISREVTDQVRSIQIKRRQVDLAKRSLEYAEQQLAIEREKLNLGRSTNFEVVSFQNQLVSQQNAEIDAIAAYLNALTMLDETLGSTLQTWQISIERLPIPMGP